MGKHSQTQWENVLHKSNDPKITLKSADHRGKSCLAKGQQHRDTRALMQPRHPAQR